MHTKNYLHNGNMVEAWDYDASIYRGISVGFFDRMHGSSKALLSVESINTKEGPVNRIVIKKKMAEKYGFEIKIVEE